MAAWSFLLSFVQKGAKKENEAGLVGGARESVGVVSSRREVTPNGEVTLVSVLFVSIIISIHAPTTGNCIF